MTVLPPSPFVSVSLGEPLETSVYPLGDTAGAELPSALAATSSEACISRDDGLLPSRETPPDLSGASVQERPLADLEPDTQYIPELFSVYAARRCKDLISPPLPQVERNIDSLALGAVGRALNLHPRDLDEDPAPLFLRKPRPAFLRALFELGDAR